MIDIDKYIEHQEHKTSPEKIKIVGNEVVFSKYCYDCNEEYIIEREPNAWIFDKNITCPHCGKDASVSHKYYQDEQEVKRRTWTHCFSCNYTDEH